MLVTLSYKSILSNDDGDLSIELLIALKYSILSSLIIFIFYAIFLKYN